MDNIKDPKLKQILEQLSGFGFTFYSFDEDGSPLVSGPNSQIVPVNVAISFANEQIQNQNNSGGSFENPNFELGPDTSSSVESSVERSLEVQKETIDQDVESEQEEPQVQQPAPNVPNKAPQVQIKRPMIKPYGAGFDPKSFNPNSISQTIKFVEKYEKVPPSSSQKWMAEQFKKFLKEMKENRS